MMTTTPHWPQVGVGATGFGAHAALPNPQNLPVINAADDLLSYFDVNACSQASLPVVASFQTAYNASGLPGQLTVDGQYGGNTMRALQNAMDKAQADAGAGPSQQAPADCFGGTVYANEPAVPALDVTPTAPATPPAQPTTVVVNPPSATTSSAMPYVIGGVVAAAAVVGGVYVAKKYKKKRHG